MRSGWTFFLRLPRMERSKGAASPGPPYFAWGCFRDFLARPCGGAQSAIPRALHGIRGTRLTPPSSRRRRNSAVGRMEGMKRIRWKKLATAAADHRAHGLIGTEILGAIDIEQRGEFRARPVDAALDGADRTAADRGCVFI